MGYSCPLLVATDVVMVMLMIMGGAGLPCPKGCFVYESMFGFCTENSRPVKKTLLGCPSDGFVYLENSAWLD